MFFRRQKQPPPSLEQQLELARQQGFTVERPPQSPRRVRLEKYGCAAVIEKEGQGRVRFIEPPGLIVDGEIARLLDGGFQKFLVTAAHGKRPALAEQLRAIHRFDEELRRVLRLPSLYNESLGTVSNRYIYDRLEGRD